MIGDKTYISIGDFIDLYYKVKQKGYNELLSKFHLSNKGRTLSKWNTISSSSDFWIIPEIRCRWNEKCTGNPNIEYEDYVVSKYFSKSKGLKMLSVGCGTGARERKFAKYPNFNLIEGVDMSEKQIDEARNHASDLKLNNIKYIVGDFTTHIFEHSTYDVILFNSSLHHFKDIHNILQTKVLPLLKDGGYLLIFEYVGPKRLQWTKQQLEFANKLLTDLPLKYKIRFNSKSIKRRIYRPGLFRMLLVDPSEAIDSDSIIPSIHNHFKIIEERKIGWDISHLLFKDIAHNFLNNDKETQMLLSYLFDKEDEYLSMTGGSDAVFGVYQK
ncbi:MAG TPA: methyltransferase domain-containing protein [Prolixibacteraceae bacterium]|jgi:ubiquinone/menaquinone biosynthesis C-methylase UbiE|nr:methyltransferase domain-containing protein [Bacteroidales bacterium]HNZ69187.1 methyltransferase domain-containing protein [Prolixibacteraceae bacterium]HOC86947.1 methyltransferase domain-containing protein [Prolixibacteraceae bacterium]HOY93261.1 methyltransferase domain-containing protein [Prolixibacteraceae bacterium]HPV17933.1 methyltransferase domain-containing protein [Prolixibacteraceae bacterium]